MVDIARRGSKAQSLSSYFRAFYPGPRWAQIPSWPPDVFALCNLVLDHTESFRFAVSPPPGRQWPPHPLWNAQVTEAAAEWRACCGRRTSALPALVDECWDVLTRAREVPLTEVSSGEAWEVCEALLTLHAVADESCAVLAAREMPSGRSFEARAWRVLLQNGSLSHLSPRRVRVVPKTNSAPRGITIRSLSRYLGLVYESVDVRWRRVETAEPRTRPRRPRKYNLLLVPWPLTVRASDFSPAPNPLGNMPTDLFGFFHFAPSSRLDFTDIGALLAQAHRQGLRADGVVLPESAVERDEVATLEDALAEQGASVLITGVRERPTTTGFGRNYVHFSVHGDDGWQGTDQVKHHRWCLDGQQIQQYHLSRVLDPHKLWWEAIDLGARAVQVVDVGGGTTTVPLVCEDLARMDEVADVLRRIGPSLVIALLLDGPQLTTRWPCRYASVLADEPGSSVLTLTSVGMALRSRVSGFPTSRAVALWNDRTSGLREIDLDPGAQAVMITATERTTTLWTADGRRHERVPDLVLTDVNQLRLGKARPVVRHRFSESAFAATTATYQPPLSIKDHSPHAHAGVRPE